MYYPYGNVAIGTATPDPQAKLAVEGHGAYAGRFTSDSLGSLAHVVHAEATAAGASDVRAVYGKSTPQDYWGYGGEFIGGFVGVYGRVIPSGLSQYYGVYGSASGGSGTNRGVSGIANGGGTNYGVYGFAGDSASNYAGYFSGRLRVSSLSGDSAAMLPDDAVSAAEMLNEPGFAAHSPYTLTTITTTAASVDSVVITIPADGYVVIEAGGIIDLNHVTGTISNVWVNVSEFKNTTPTVDGFQWGFVPAASATAPYHENFHCHRVYSRVAGSYTFYLNGYLFNGAGTYTVSYKWIKATYYPTSYGPVTTLVAEVAGGNDIATAGQALDEQMSGPRPLINQEVDLRDLELTALRARVQAEQAERKLLEAQLAKEREKEGRPDQR